MILPDVARTTPAIVSSSVVFPDAGRTDDDAVRALRHVERDVGERERSRRAR